MDINGFMRHLNDKFSAKVSHFTSSAFIQTRKKIDPEVFKHLSSILTKSFYRPDNDEVKLLYGLRILAADSSGLTLPFTKELQEGYGVVSMQKPWISYKQKCLYYSMLRINWRWT